MIPSPAPAMARWPGTSVPRHRSDTDYVPHYAPLRALRGAPPTGRSVLGTSEFRHAEVGKESCP